jgi:hypothetical protein
LGPRVTGIDYRESKRRATWQSCAPCSMW